MIYDKYTCEDVTWSCRWEKGDTDIGKYRSKTRLKLQIALGKQHTWSVADSSIKRSTDDANIKRLVRSRQAPDVLEVGERRHSTESPLLRVNGFW